MRHFNRLYHEVKRVGRPLYSTIHIPRYRIGYTVILGVCVLAVLVNITTHLLRELGQIGPKAGEWLVLSTDRGLLEIVGYIILAIAVFLLIRAAVRTNSVLYVYWTVFTVYMIADDSLKFHETVGKRISVNLPKTVFGVRAPDVGELLYFAIVGSIFLALLLLSYAFSRWRDRGLSLWLLVPTGSLVVCGVGFDILHGLAWFTWNARRETGFVISLLEDGGELFSMGLFLIFCLAITKVLDAGTSIDR